MNNKQGISIILAAATMLLACCSDAPGICDGQQLQSTLDGARPGDIVTMGACTIEGTFEIPSGVTLEGADAASSIIKVLPGEIGLILSPGPGHTYVRNLRVESRTGTAAILAEDIAQVSLHNVTLVADRGIGIGLERVDAADFLDVGVIGPIFAANANDLALADQNAVTGDVTATHGVVFFDVGNAHLFDLTTNGFAKFGALFVNSSIVWTGGDASANLGTGVMVDGGRASLIDIEINETLKGLRLIPAYSAVFANSADILTQRLIMRDNEGYGALHSEATAIHLDAVVEGNGDAGMWVQNVSFFEMAGPDTVLKRNKFGGVVAVNSSNVALSDVTIDSTELSPWLLDPENFVMIGDGVHLDKTTQGVDLTRVKLVDNERVGLLIDIGSQELSSVDIEFNEVEVAVAGVAGMPHGAILQGENSVIAPGTDDWDTNITRDQGATDNDSGLLEPLGVPDIIDSGNISSHRDNLIQIIRPMN